MQGAGRISALTFFFFFFSFSFSALFSSPSKCCCRGSINTNNDPQELPLFREAPVFHNGRECVTPTTIVEIEPEENPLTAVCNRGSYYRTSSVHVAMTLEGGYMRGTLAAVLSIVQHAACPENIIFHFLACSLLEDHVSSRVRSTFPYLRFHIYPFDADRVRDRISASVREALEHPLNYARIYLAETLPDCIHRVIYLDSDLLLFDDIAKLWATELHGYPLAAPEYCQVNLASYFTATFWSDPALSSVFRNRRRRPCYFNTGVMVMDLRKWREEGYARVIEMWMVLQKERRIYELGSLPPFLLLFAGRVEPVGHCWNQHGLGGDNYKGRCRALHPGPVSLLHWSGKGKPWDRLDAHQPCPLDSLWAPYDLLDVSSSSRPY